MIHTQIKPSTSSIPSSLPRQTQACFFAQLAVLVLKPWTWLGGILESFTLTLFCILDATWRERQRGEERWEASLSHGSGLLVLWHNPPLVDTGAIDWAFVLAGFCRHYLIARLLNPWQDSLLLGILLIPREFGLQKRLAAGERIRRRGRHCSEVEVSGARRCPSLRLIYEPRSLALFGLGSLRKAQSLRAGLVRQAYLDALPKVS